MEEQRQFATGAASALAPFAVKERLWYWVEFKSTLSDLSSPFGGNIDRIGSAGQGSKLASYWIYLIQFLFYKGIIYWIGQSRTNFNC